MSRRSNVWLSTLSMMQNLPRTSLAPQRPHVKRESLDDDASMEHPCLVDRVLVWVPWLGEEGDAVDVDVVVAKRGIAVRRIIEVDDEIFRVMARHPQQVWTSAQLSLDRSAHHHQVDGVEVVGGRQQHRMVLEDEPLMLHGPRADDHAMAVPLATRRGCGHEVGFHELLRQGGRRRRRGRRGCGGRGEHQPVTNRAPAQRRSRAGAGSTGRAWLLLALWALAGLVAREAAGEAVGLSVAVLAPVSWAKAAQAETLKAP